MNSRETSGNSSRRSHQRTEERIDPSSSQERCRSHTHLPQRQKNLYRSAGNVCVCMGVLCDGSTAPPRSSSRHVKPDNHTPPNSTLPPPRSAKPLSTTAPPPAANQPQCSALAALRPAPRLLALAVPRLPPPRPAGSSRRPLGYGNARARAGRHSGACARAGLGRLL